ncbi:MAG: hypothetical protein V9H69_14070 [Anaerolineae bacterium]
MKLGTGDWRCDHDNSVLANADIKHHRVPAPGMSFDKPNLPFLLAELEHLLTTD